MIGLPGSNLSRIKIIDDRRPIETHSKLRFIQAATNFNPLDLYLIEADTDINNIAPMLAGMTFGMAYEFVYKLANKYELILTTCVYLTLWLTSVRWEIMEAYFSM